MCSSIHIKKSRITLISKPIPVVEGIDITEIVHTLQHILLHLNLIELVGANDDAVVGEVNTATGF